MKLKYEYGTLLFFLLAWLTPSLFKTESSAIAALSIGYPLTACLLVVFYFKSFYRASFEKKSTVARIVIFGGLGIVGSLILQFSFGYLESLLRTPVISENTLNLMATAKKQPLFLLSIIFGAPIMEEFTFRRSLGALLDQRFPLWLVMILSSSLFAIIHFDGHLFLYFSLGFFFHWIYKTSGSIWSSILTHAGMNAYVVLIQLLFVS